MGRGDTSSVADVVAAAVSHASDPLLSPEEGKKCSIPTGLTLLNLSLADSPFFGYREGSVVNICGDSHSGKTLLALTCLAEAAQLEAFDGYDLILDDAEEANAFDVEVLFGTKLAKRLQPPPGNDEEHPNSKSVEDFQDNIRRCLNSGKPFIYVLDSLDSLTSDEEVSRMDADMKAREAGKEIKGSYGMVKPKKMSELFRVIVSDIKATSSLLIVLSQTRDNIDPMSFTKKTRSGGRALEFYSSIIMWLSHTGKVTVTAQGKPRTIGNKTKIKVTKNKYTGKLRDVEFQSYYSIGLDDIGGMVEWMLDEGYWKGGGQTKILADELGLEATKKKLIQEIEEQGLVRKLQKVVGKKWRQLEESIKLDRKPRFK